MAVQQALTHALNLWKHVTAKDYPNGAIVFCSEDVAEILQLPTPLRRRLYDCGRKFNTSVIQDAISAQLGGTYGIVVIDGADAAFGKVMGLAVASSPVITDLGRLGSHTASRTRRGGQSALRYSRLRDEAELAFLRKVSERATVLFTDVQGLIIAGKADMKHKLQAELPQALQRQVLCTVTLSCDASADALHQAASQAFESVATAEQAEVENVVKQFVNLGVNGSLCCYGEMHTARALELGAVNQLLLSVDLQTLLSVDEWHMLAKASGARVIQVHPRSEESTAFCKSFVVGACLRWAIDTQLLEEAITPSAQESVALKDFGVPPSSIVNTELTVPDVGAPSSEVAEAMLGLEGHLMLKRREALAMFSEKLEELLGDTAAVEALTTSIEVVLEDEASSKEDVVEGVLAIAHGEDIPEEFVLDLIDSW